MGWLGSSRQSTTQTQTQTTTPTNPQWVTDAVQAGVARGRELSQRGFTPYNGQMTAGLDPLQTAAREQAVQTAGGWRPAVDAAGGFAAAGGTAQARDVNAPVVGAPAVARAPGPIRTTGVTGTVGADNMGRYANPWTQAVLDTSMSAIRRTGDQAQARLGQDLAARGAYGGSREAILRGQIEEGVQRNAGEMAATIGREGFNTAAALGQQDATRAQDANLFTAGARNEAEEAAAARRGQANLFNAGQANEIAVGDANRQLVAQQANQQADNQAATRAIAAGGLFGQLGALTGEQGRADIGMLDTLGAAGRDVTQAGLDAQRGEFDREQNWDVDNYRLMLEGIYGAPFNLFSGGTTTGTGTGTTRSFSTGAALQDIGRLVSAGATLFSDARLKTEAEPIGIDEGGLTWWRYRYLWDAPGVQRVGVMAQDAPAHAVHKGPGGFLMVDYGAL